MTTRSTPRLAAFSLAVVATLSLLAGIDRLASAPDGVVPQLAQQQAAAPRG